MYLALCICFWIDWWLIVILDFRIILTDFGIILTDFVSFVLISMIFVLILRFSCWFCDCRTDFQISSRFLKIWKSDRKIVKTLTESVSQYENRENHKNQYENHKLISKSVLMILKTQITIKHQSIQKQMQRAYLFWDWWMIDGNFGF